eukprot:scaffold76764_cov26-Tisochrysis_lutea.AAC.1
MWSPLAAARALLPYCEPWRPLHAPPRSAYWRERAPELPRARQPQAVLSAPSRAFFPCPAAPPPAAP